MRGEIWDFPVNFSGHNILLTAHDAIILAEKKEYPIILETLLVEKKGELSANNFNQLINWLNLNLNFLDEKILIAESRMIADGVFAPRISLSEEHKNMSSPIDHLVQIIRLNNNE